MGYQKITINDALGKRPIADVMLLPDALRSVLSFDPPATPALGAGIPWERSGDPGVIRTRDPQIRKPIWPGSRAPWIATLLPCVRCHASDFPHIFRDKS